MIAGKRCGSEHLYEVKQKVDFKNESNSLLPKLFAGIFGTLGIKTTLVAETLVYSPELNLNDLKTYL